MMKDSIRDIQACLREKLTPRGSSRYGLVIGIEKYSDSRLNLRCANADAKAIYDLMIDQDCGMFSNKNVELLLDTDATKENIWRALANLRRKAGENDTVWVYYAGHAAPEGSNLFWVTYDSDVDDLYGTGLANEQISKVLSDIQARQMLVLLDCCHAAATSIQKNPTRTVLTAEEIFACYKGKGRITLSSSDGKEKSIELGDLGHGVFTYFLEKGLRGEADIDSEGIVSADKLWNYLRDKVKKASTSAGNPQNPVLIGEMTHDLIFTLNPIAAKHKKHIADTIAALVGLSDDHLTTEEAELCIEILRCGPRTVEQRQIASEFNSLVSGALKVRTFKLLLKAVKTGAAQIEDIKITENHSKIKGDEETESTTVEKTDKIVSSATTVPEWKQWYAKNITWGKDTPGFIIYTMAVFLPCIASTVICRPILILPIGMVTVITTMVGLMSFAVVGLVHFLHYKGCKNRYKVHCAEICLKAGDYIGGSDFMLSDGKIGSFDFMWSAGKWGVDKTVGGNITVKIADLAREKGDIDLASELYKHASHYWDSPYAKHAIEHLSRQTKSGENSATHMKIKIRDEK